MEHRGRIVPRDQYRLAWLTFHEIRVIGNDCRDLAVDSFLIAIGVHPRARAFTRARVRIEIPETDVFLCCLVGHFPDANVGMCDGNVGYRRKLEIEEFARDPEDSFAQLLELE